MLLSLINSTLTVQSKPTGKLRVGYYFRTCPLAEIIVRRAVNKAVSQNPGIAAGLIRLHFHDCFVRGCDASVLLNTSPGKPTAEKDSFVNLSLRGFEVIDEAKAQIEAICPNTVSCADILAFSARDSALKSGFIAYDVPSGRKDGLVSLSSEVLTNLPAPFLNAAQLRDNFQSKGMSLDDMVTLSGAHSIGVSHCSSFANRLSGFNSTTLGQDPSMDPGYATYLRSKCPVNSGNNAVDNDILTPNRLDSRYYETLKIKKGLLTSDQTLYDSDLTRNIVVDNARFGSGWGRKFAAAMVRMGDIDVLTGDQGEIRRNCNFVN
ncbi:hypothetical protein CASFOL_003606 [Castilleja foliolosa]|uniref:Peroxidase n=1 Tax=Castilleja foliolosa TaxID=1961234 RepID=A0ABD3EHM9_9LAMI